MTMDERLPAFTDAELKNLYANAARLARTGTPAQQSEAERLLPLIGAEVQSRADSAKARAAEARASRRKPTTSAAKPSAAPARKRAVAKS